ncbi:MAG TPA: porin [Gallionella sp.]|nr:porin [Gallionella sp.]
MILFIGSATAAEPPSTNEMWRIIQEQQKQIEALKSHLNQTDRKVEATGDVLEQVAATKPGSGDASWAERTRIGGYGELIYNDLTGKGGAGNLNQLDFRRFVLYFSHQFNDRIRLFSELELENSIAGAGQNGAVELEQAYLEFDLNDRHRAKGGIFLIPVGIMNETHEPNTFYGVERNPVERNIIPTTWWAGGAALSGELGSGFSYDAGVHEGLNITDASYTVRKGRQKTSKAEASDLAYTARLKWTGMPGVEIAGTYQHQTDTGQGLNLAAGSANLYELHTAISKGPLGLRALYARWDLNGSGPAAVGANEQFGWYIEPSFKFNDQWGVFARYNLWDNAAGNSSASEKKQIDVGANFWPHPSVVLKADYQVQDNVDGKEQKGFNLGLGYQF